MRLNLKNYSIPPQIALILRGLIYMMRPFLLGLSFDGLYRVLIVWKCVDCSEDQNLY